MKVLYICSALTAVSAAIVGIDLGHKFTKAMMVAPGIRFEIIPTDGGQRKDLSAIYVNPKVKNGELTDAERSYGSQIGSSCSRSPEMCAANLKSLLGKTTDDEWVEKYVLDHPQFSIGTSSKRSNAIEFQLGNPKNSFAFSVEELTAMSLAELKERVLEALTHHPQARAIAEDVALAVPPYANQHSRYAFKDALSLANYSSVLGLVDEGCAAALAYISDKKLAAEEYNNQTVYQMIYDMGAGSTTATLFSYTPYENKTIVLDVESVGYDDSLGGDLFTQHVYEILLKKFIQDFGLDETLELPFKLSSRLMESAEKAKTILSANGDSKVSLESFWKDEDFKATITRQEFEEATAHLIERIINPIHDALKRSPSGPKKIAEVESVILNGGSTRTPFVQKHLVGILGEGKVSKVLNADEACAYGTTIRAYQLKLQSSTDLVLVDRVLSDFEISINGTNDKQLVFPKGSSAGTKKSIDLGAASGDIAIDLHENGKVYASYNVSKVASKTKDLACLPDDVSLHAEFVLGVDKIFSLDNLFLNCSKPIDTAPDLNNLTSFNLTGFNFTKKFTRSKAKLVIPPLAFTTLRPYSRKEKKDFLSTLTHLKTLEKEKLEFEHTKNILESLCYNLNFYIEDHHETLSENLGATEIERIQTEASEVVEWLDFDADSSSLTEISEKLESVQQTKKTLESTVRMSESDLSLSALEDLLSDGNNLAQSVQDSLLKFGSQINEVREQYEAEEFNFEVENDRIMKKLYGATSQEDLVLDKNFKALKQALADMADMIGLPKPKFDKLTSANKFNASETVNSLTNEMTMDVQILELQHQERIAYLHARLEKLKERKKQKELKAKLREEREKERKEKEKTSGEDTDVPESSTSEGAAHETTKANSNEHDEL